MTMRERAGRELRGLRGALARARADIEAGRRVDLDPLEARVADLCERIATLAAEEARGLRAPLLALSDDFGHLTRAIESRLDALKGELGGVAERRQAADAYHKSLGPRR
jgi:hypothetical protein